MKGISSWIVLFLIFTLVYGCGEQPFYEKTVSFEGRKWDRSVKPAYKVDVQNIDVTYNFTLILRTTTDYQYNNLWIFLKTTTPDGTSAREPFEILITNEDGSWIGNKTGSVVETQLNFNKRKLPIKGEYTFTIEQGITESEIDEVLDLGFKVEITD